MRWIVAPLFALVPYASAQVTDPQLRKLLGPSELTFDAASESIQAAWRFEHEDQMRAFETRGRTATLHPEGGVLVAPRSILMLRELKLRAPCRITLDVQLGRKSSILDVRLAEPGDSQSTDIVFLNRPLHVDDGIARRRDGVSGSHAPSRMTSERSVPIVIEIDEGGAKVSVDGASAGERTTPLAEIWGLELQAARGTVRVHSIAIDGTIVTRSLRKLVGAAETIRDEERKTAPNNALFARISARIWMSLEERQETRARIRKLVFDSGKLGGQSRKKLDKNERQLVRRTLRDLDSSHSKSRTRAERFFAQFRVDHPKEAFVSFLVADAYRGDKRKPEAMKVLRAVLTRDDKWVDGWRTLGILLLETNRSEDANECFEKVLSMRANDNWARAFSSLALTERGQFEAALAQIKRARYGKTGVRSLKLLQEHIELLSKGPFGKETKTHESESYFIESNLDRTEIEALGARLDRYRLYLRQRFPLPHESATRSRVWVFDSKEQYMSYTDTLGRRAEHTLGVFHPSLNTLLLFFSMSDAKNQNVLLHEGFHQYLHEVATDAPLWFHEGLAEYFGATTFDDAGNPIEGGILPGRLAALRKRFAEGGEPVPFPTLIRMGRKDFMSPMHASRHYAQSWAMVHFFQRGPRADASEAFGRYTRALLDGESEARAWEGSFGTWDEERTTEVETAWREYVDKDLLPKLDGGGNK